MHFTPCVMPSSSTFTAASSSIGAGFESSTRLTCYGSSAEATSRMVFANELFLNGHIPADKALHAPMKAAAVGSTPTPGRCSWACSTAAPSAVSLDQLEGPRRCPSSLVPLSPSPEVERKVWLNGPKRDESLIWALVGWIRWKAQAYIGWLSWACPLISLDLGLNWGTRPKLVMDVYIGFAQEDFGLGSELQPRPSSCGWRALCKSFTNPLF